MRTSRGHIQRAWWAAAALAPAMLAPVSVNAGTQSPASATGDTAALVEWNMIAQANTIPLRPTAHGSLRGIAMVQGAVYDAVNAIEGRYQPYLLDTAGLPIEDASVVAAIATAARDVLAAIGLPEQIADLDAAYRETLAAIDDGPSEDAGVAVGAAAASAMLRDRADDGFMAPFEFVIADGPGAWRPMTAEALDPDPWVGDLDPFILESPDQFPTTGPDALTSAEYTADFNEVLELGALDSTTRTQDQTTAAIFWQTSPIAIWNTLARDLMAAQGLDVVDAARLLAMVDLAGADGAIACWNDKYRWNFWRPITAIHEADTDGNPDTVPDSNWQPLFDPETPTDPPLATPPFPDHPSGHTCVSGSVLYLLESLFGSDVAFDIHSSRFPDQPRHFDTFVQALDEVINARVWGGIHFRAADVQGAALGEHVATWLTEHFFQPAGSD